MARTKILLLLQLILLQYLQILSRYVKFCTASFGPNMLMQPIKKINVTQPNPTRGLI